MEKPGTPPATKYQATLRLMYLAAGEQHARSTALEHFELIRDALRVEGTDEPCEISVVRIERSSDGAPLDFKREDASKPISS